jgi:pimeloyl-ACP methyl ester carboxylesterase
VTSGDTLSQASGGPVADVKAVVLVAHGGRSVSTAPTSAVQPAVLRMVPVTWAIKKALRGSDALVLRPRFEVQGWNGEQASPAADLERVLDVIVGTFGPVPVVLVGHSMGARAAFRAAGHPAVTAVAGLAPWLPLGEPVSQLAGRRVLLAHGTADRITSPQETWAYAGRAREVTEVAVIDVRGGEHTMLRRAALWHEIAADFCRLALHLSTDPTDVSAAIAWHPGDPPRAVL